MKTLTPTIKVLKTKTIRGDRKEDGCERVELFSSSEGLPFGVRMTSYDARESLLGVVGLVRCTSLDQAKKIFTSWTVNFL